MASVTDFKRKLKACQRKLDLNKTQIQFLDSEVKSIKTENDNLTSEKNRHQNTISDVHIDNRTVISFLILQGLVQDEADLMVYNDETHTYTNELVECAMNLTDLKVSSKNVGPVIGVVSSLCGKIPNQLPSKSCVNNFADLKLVISQK